LQIAAVLHVPFHPPEVVQLFPATPAGHVQTPVVHVGTVIHEVIKDAYWFLVESQVVGAGPHVNDDPWYDAYPVQQEAASDTITPLVLHPGGGFGVVGAVVVTGGGGGVPGHVSVVVLQSAFRRTYLIVFPSGHVPAVLSITGVQVVVPGHVVLYVVQSAFRITYIIVFPSGHVPAVFNLPAVHVPDARLRISTCCLTKTTKMGSVITRSNNPARSTPSRDFFFGFSVGGSTGGAEEIVGSGAGVSGGGIIRESELGAIGSGVVAGSKEVTGGPPAGGGGTGAGSIGTSGTGSTTGGTGGAVTSEGGVVPDGGCVFD
jgi:hypothetical protein